MREGGDGEARMALRARAKARARAGAGVKVRAGVWARDEPADLAVSRRRCRGRAAAPVYNACACGAHVMHMQCTCTCSVRSGWPAVTAADYLLLAYCLLAYQADSRQQLLARRPVSRPIRGLVYLGVVGRGATSPWLHCIDEGAGACSGWESKSASLS